MGSFADLMAELRQISAELDGRDDPGDGVTELALDDDAADTGGDYE